MSKLEIFTKTKKKIVLASVFLVMKVEKNFQSTFKKTFKRHFDLLLARKGQHHFTLIKDFKIFMYNQTLHRDGNFFSLILVAFF